MRNAEHTLSKSRILGLLVGCLCLSSPEVWAALTISKVELDNRPVAITSGSIDLKVYSTTRSVKFYFTQGTGSPRARLRYKLEGFDTTWRELQPPLRPPMMVISFEDLQRQGVSNLMFELAGETPGWRGSAGQSDFVTRREQVMVPERATMARIYFTSAGHNPWIGLIAVDALRVVVEHPEQGRREEYDLSVMAGTDLDRPLGSPDQWAREGTRSDMAQLQTRLMPSPHPVLVINDVDPDRFAVWSLKVNRLLPVHPGDRLTLEWQTAYSVGSSGPGTANYSNLECGNYMFRVAVVKANGDLTATEVSLPLAVVAPLYYRWDFWFVLLLMVILAVGWTGRALAHRQMQRNIARLEREQTLEQERARIASDLHDDIGAGLTAIAIQSDWVHIDLEGNPTADTRRRIEYIRESAIELTRKVDEIVWAVTPANDTLKRFLGYLTQNAAQFLNASGLRVRFDIPQDLPDGLLPGKTRHLLFLAMREALNNVVKHARADLVRIDIRMQNAALRLGVEDNGCGFTPEQVGADGIHEGLNGIHRRMEEIGGQLCLTSRPGGGTRIELIAPLQWHAEHSSGGTR